MTKPMMKKMALALLSTTVMVPAVMAQESAEAQITSVYDRQREDFSALGIRTGSFLFYPKIVADANYDTNIYKGDEAVRANTDDLIAIIKPSFRLASDWNNNYFAVDADAKIGRYMDATDEDYEDFKIGMNGRIDVTQGTSITMDASYDDGHEDRGSPDASNDPDSTYTNYTIMKAGVGFKRDEGMFSLAANAKYQDSNYDDSSRNGVVTNNDDRDRQRYSGDVRIGYHLNEDYEAFVKLTAVAVEYDDRRDDNGVIHDSDGWDVVGGAAFNVGGKSEGEVYVGYVKRDFDSASLGDVDDFKFGASILWAPSGLTSLKFAVDRDVRETTVRQAGVAASGILSTKYSVRAEHELQRNFLLHAEASYSDMDYVGVARNDDMYKAGFGAKYLINRNLALAMNYRFDKRTANNITNQDYDRHAVIVRLTSQW